MPNREIFNKLTEVKVLIEQWRKEYNHIRPQNSLGLRTPAPDAIMPVFEIKELYPFWEQVRL